MESPPNAKQLLQELKSLKFEKSFLELLSYGTEHQTEIIPQELNNPGSHFNKFSESIAKNNLIQPLHKRFKIESYEKHFYFLLFMACGHAHPAALENFLNKNRDNTGNFKEKFKQESIIEIQQILDAKIDKITFRIKNKEKGISIENHWIISEIKRLIQDHNWTQERLGPNYIFNGIKLNYENRLIAKESFAFFKSIGKTKNISEILSSWILFLSNRIKIKEIELEEPEKPGNKKRNAVKTDLDMRLQQLVKGYFKED